MTTTTNAIHRFVKARVRALEAGDAAVYSAFAERLFRETYVDGYDPADVDAYVADVRSRYDWKAHSEMMQRQFKVRVGQQKQKKAK